MVKVKKSIAQGTIEYLVIIAVVVVISLVIVGLFITIFDSPSQEITDSSSQMGAVATGGISIVESVIDPDGDSLIRLTNNSSDAITLTKINIGGVDNNFSEQLVGLDSKVFSLSALNSSCPCASGQKSVKCEVKIIYTTAPGVTQTEYRTINAQCVNNSTPVNVGGVVVPLDGTAPTVSLNSPANNYNSALRSVSFSFSTNEVGTCVLRAGSDSNSYTISSSGSNTIEYTFSADELVDWNIACTDASSNMGYSSSRSLDVDANSYQITTCVELSEIGLTGNYELMNDIDCVETETWGPWTNNCATGSNFEPIGTHILDNYGSFVDFCVPNVGFSGTLDGKNYSIKNLKITNNSNSSIGLFAKISDTGKVMNLTISDSNIRNISNTTYYFTGAFAAINLGEITNVNLIDSNVYGPSTVIGGIVGRDSQVYGLKYGTINYANVDGVIVSAYSIGGLIIGSAKSDVNNCAVSNSILNGNNQLGGIVGFLVNGTLAHNSVIDTNINNGSPRGSVGEIVGYNEGGTLISNTYSNVIIQN
jgi:hypothetical protein